MSIRAPRSARAASSPSVPGLGLVEVVLLLSAIGLGVTVALPIALRQTAARERQTAARETTQAAEQLARTLRQARSRAALLERPVSVEIEPAGLSSFYTAYVRLRDTLAETPARPGEVAAVGIPFDSYRQGIQGTALPRRVRFAVGRAPQSRRGQRPPPALALPANPIVFQPDGAVRWPAGPRGESGTIFLSHAKHDEEVRAVSISRAGSVGVWRLEGGVWR